MSSPVMPEIGSASIRWSTALVTRAVVAAAIVLSRVRPAIIRWVLLRVVKRGQRPSIDRVLDIRRNVFTVSSLCAGEGCLPRSIAVAILARCYGFGVTWRTGVREYPFTAHAWIEVAGTPVGENADLSMFITTLYAAPLYLGEK